VDVFLNTLVSDGILLVFGFSAQDTYTQIN